MSGSMLPPLPNPCHGSIDQLLNADGKIINSGARKKEAEMFNSYFCTAFGKERDIHPI